MAKEGSFLSMYQGGGSVMSRCVGAKEEKATKNKSASSLLRRGEAPGKASS